MFVKLCNILPINKTRKKDCFSTVVLVRFLQIFYFTVKILQSGSVRKANVYPKQFKKHCFQTLPNFYAERKYAKKETKTKKHKFQQLNFSTYRIQKVRAQCMSQFTLKSPEDTQK